jgi:DNA polymerase-3 subunit epsilon
VTGWHWGRLCAFDVESTSPDPDDARIVTACIAMVGGGQPTESRTWLISPGIDIPAEATAIHGITTEHAREHGEDPATALKGIVEGLYAAWAAGIPVLAFNASYDLTALSMEVRRHGGPGFTVTGPVIDPFVIDRAVDQYRKGRRTLTACCEHYGVRLDGAHDAAADAIAAARVAWAIGQRYPDIAAMRLPDLHTAQAGWHRERQADFAAYLRRVGKPADDVCGDWPIRHGGAA